MAPPLPDLVRTLQRAEAAICAQIAIHYKRTAFDLPSTAALETEVKDYEHVDALCRSAAAVMTQWLQVAGCRVRLLVPAEYCEPVLFRIRDAVQLLVDIRQIPADLDGRPDKFFEELLVNRWHSYAEPYCAQRQAGVAYQRPARHGEL